MAVVRGGGAIGTACGLDIIGSEDATTCHIVFLVHRDSGTAAVAHLGTRSLNILVYCL
jgi:hypothetical protein